jgi:hypothetical protein
MYNSAFPSVAATKVFALLSASALAIGTLAQPLSTAIAPMIVAGNMLFMVTLSASR